MKNTTIASTTAGSLILAFAAGCSALVSTPRTHTPVEPAEFGHEFETGAERRA